MPFKKQGPNDYTGPSGKHFNLNQVRLYYAHGGSFPAHAEGGTVKPKERPMARAKSYGTFDAAYAAGGPVLGRTRDFLKEKDEFRDPDEGERKSADVVGDTADEDQVYPKGKKESFGSSKTLKPVKPRK